MKLLCSPVSSWGRSLHIKCQCGGWKCLWHSLQGLPAPLVSLGWLCCSMGLTQALSRGCRGTHPEWCHRGVKVYTDNSQNSHQNSHQTPASHIHEKLSDHKPTGTLCHQEPNLGQGRKYRAAEISHTPSPPEQWLPGPHTKTYDSCKDCLTSDSKIQVEVKINFKIPQMHLEKF